MSARQDRAPLSWLAIRSHKHILSLIWHLYAAYEGSSLFRVAKPRQPCDGPGQQRVNNTLSTILRRRLERKPDNSSRTSSSCVCWAFVSSFRPCSRSRLDKRNSSGRLKSAGFPSRLPPLLSFPLPPEDGIGGGVLTSGNTWRYFPDEHSGLVTCAHGARRQGATPSSTHTQISRCRAQAIEQM